MNASIVLDFPIDMNKKCQKTIIEESYYQHAMVIAKMD